MQFTSIYFVLFFLPAVIVGYHLAGKRSARIARLFLVGASLFFCGTTDLWSLFILLAEIAGGYLFSRAILRRGPETAGAKRLLAAGIALQVFTLVLFKYMGFLVGSIGILLQRDLVWRELILPLGVSYTTFTQIAYLADCCGGRIKRPVDFRTYALYLSFFPKLAQGPIASGTAFLDELSDERAGRVTADGLADGVVLFALGMAKKLLIADTFGGAVQRFFSVYPYITGADIVVMILSYTFQIYFDFSGYSDMAIGAARMLGFTLPVNFNSPYRAKSFTDFWRRWHMSLTGFLREYLYFPLGGSRKGTLRACVNIMIVFLVSGLWHGANWTFILWGFCHGILQVVERLTGRIREHIPGWIRQAVTFAGAAVLWGLFRSESVAQFLDFLSIIADRRPLYIREEILELFRLPGTRTVLNALGMEVSDAVTGMISMFLWMALAFGICLQKRNNESGPYRRSGGLLLFCACLFVICVFSMNGVSAFIYTSF